MKRVLTTLLLLILIFFGYPFLMKTYSTLLIRDTSREGEIPEQFRIHSEFNISASGQFTGEQLQHLIRTLPPKKLVIIDLREETHGFINGMPVSYYKKRNDANQELPKEKILRKEETAFDRISQQPYMLVFHHKMYPVPYRVESAVAEKELVQSKSVEYIRLPITDHSIPSASIVDQWVSLVSSQPSDTWFHIHCAAGKGRSTLMLALYEMIRSDHSLEEVAATQEALRGIDLLANDEKQEWKRQLAEERISFLEQFDRYRKETKFTLPFSAFVKNSPREL